MNRKLWPSALLALLSFALALYVGLKDQKDRRIGDAWLKIEAANIKTITYQDPQKSVLIEPLGGSRAWVTTQDKVQNKEEKFLAGSRVRDLFFSLSPIWATRKLGSVTPKKTKDYGFDTEKKTLRIELREGSPIELGLGTRGFQSSDYFVLDKNQKKIFLWNREALDLISDPARLAMRDLQFFNPETIDSIGIEGSGISPRELQKKSKLWYEQSKPVNPEDPLFAWLESFARVAIKGYRERLEFATKPLLHMVVRDESFQDLRIYFDEKSESYWLDFGAGKPELLLDRQAFEPIFAAWKEDKISRKK